MDTTKSALDTIKTQEDAARERSDSEPFLPKPTPRPYPAHYCADCGCRISVGPFDHPICGQCR